MTHYTHEQIAARLANRTPGEWEWDDFTQNIYVDNVFVAEVPHQPDAEFISAAPDIVAQLLARVDALEAALRAIRSDALSHAEPDAPCPGMAMYIAGLAGRALDTESEATDAP